MRSPYRRLLALHARWPITPRSLAFAGYPRSELQFQLISSHEEDRFDARADGRFSHADFCRRFRHRRSDGKRRFKPRDSAVTTDCGASSAPRIRTTLYFGLSRLRRYLSELEWQIFLRDEVTKRFADGLTVWQAEGQWQNPAGGIDREQSKVLLLVHADTASGAASGAGDHSGISHGIRSAICAVWGKLAGLRCGVGAPPLVNT